MSIVYLYSFAFKQTQQLSRIFNLQPFYRLLAVVYTQSILNSISFFYKNKRKFAEKKTLNNCTFPS